MGLDMYLRAVTNGLNDKNRDKLLRVLGLPTFVHELHYGVIELEVGYWRNAQATNKWFVDHVMNGKLDSELHDVSFDTLKDLYDTLVDAKKNPDEWNKWFPATIDEQDNIYLDFGNEIDHGISQLNRILKAKTLWKGGWTIRYQASF